MISNKITDRKPAKMADRKLEDQADDISGLKLCGISRMQMTVNSSHYVKKCAGKAEWSLK